MARDPALMVSRLMLGTIHLSAGQPEDAVRELEAARATAPDAPVVLGALGQAYALAGDRARALVLVDALRAQPGQAGTWSALAKIHLALGDRDRAISELEQALAARDPFYSSEPLVAPLFDALRDDPRFAAIVRAAGLDPARLAVRRTASASR